jgi:hypothetical protein
MMLTPIDPDRLPQLLARFAHGLGCGAARAVLGRIAGSCAAMRAQGALALSHHRVALGVLARLGMAARPGSPQEDFSWDGQAVRADTEAYVLLHEAAHFQLAAPERRRRIDFGLGPGPETGNRAAATAAACLYRLAVEQEEAMASLLGILWEVELGQPALASFLDQNWLEGAARPGAADHFRRTLAALGEGGFITPTGRPLLTRRTAPDGDEARLYSFTAPVRLET